MKSKKETPRDVSPYTEKKKTKTTIDLNIRELPWTDKQKEFINLALDKKTKVVILRGVAGTAKTILAVYCSLRKIKEKKSSEIYYSRVPVESSVHGIGYIKGTSEEKMSPYTQPLVDKLNELLPIPLTAMFKGELETATTFPLPISVLISKSIISISKVEILSVFL